MYTAQEIIPGPVLSFNARLPVARANYSTFCKQRKQFCRSRLCVPRPVTLARADHSKHGSLPVVTQPSSANDVDRELWTVLDLASDNELEGVHDILFGQLLPVQLSPARRANVTRFYCHETATTVSAVQASKSLLAFALHHRD